jgi:hypothetical protein
MALSATRLPTDAALCMALQPRVSAWLGSAFFISSRFRISLYTLCVCQTFSGAQRTAAECDEQWPTLAAGLGCYGYGVIHQHPRRVYGMPEGEFMGTCRAEVAVLRCRLLCACYVHAIRMSRGTSAAYLVLLIAPARRSYHQGSALITLVGLINRGASLQVLL